MWYTSQAVALVHHESFPSFFLFRVAPQFYTNPLYMPPCNREPFPTPQLHELVNINNYAHPGFAILSKL